MHDIMLYVSLSIQIHTLHWIGDQFRGDKDRFWIRIGFVMGIPLGTSLINTRDFGVLHLRGGGLPSFNHITFPSLFVVLFEEMNIGFKGYNLL